MAPNTNWIHVHVTRIKRAPKFDQMKLKWIFSLNTTTKLPPKPYKTVIRWIHEHTQIAKIAPKNNNRTLLTLDLFLFMINLNLPTMSRAHEHKKTTDHNLIPITHNLWHNTRKVSKASKHCQARTNIKS